MLKTGDSLYDSPAEFAAVIAENLYENEDLTQRYFDNNADVFVTEMLASRDIVVSDAVNYTELSDTDRIRCISSLYQKYGLSFIFDNILDDEMYLIFNEQFDESTFDEFLKYMNEYYNNSDFEEIDENIVVSILLEEDNFTNTKSFWQNVFDILPA